jgi:hypothetical protein
MTKDEFSYNTEMCIMRVESLHEGERLREDVLISTIYAQQEMIDYLKERLAKHGEKIY